jgi:hypothetical protein
MLNWKDSLVGLAPQAGSKNDGIIALLKASSTPDFRNINFNQRNSPGLAPRVDFVSWLLGSSACLGFDTNHYKCLY